MAEPTMMRAQRPHELRIGYGDPLFETMVWHASPTLDYGEQTYHYRFTGHVMAEYQYRFNYWFSLGCQVDYQQVWWDRRTYTGEGVTEEKDRYFYDICMIPTFRFTYLHTYWVNLYSSVGAGLLVNGGTETNFHGKQLAVAPVVDVAVIGVSVGHDMLFGSLEVGGLTSLTGMNMIYMVGSRLLTATIGVRF